MLILVETIDKDGEEVDALRNIICLGEAISQHT